MREWRCAFTVALEHCTLAPNVKTRDSNVSIFLSRPARPEGKANIVITASVFAAANETCCIAVGNRSKKRGSTEVHAQSLLCAVDKFQRNWRMKDEINTVRSHVHRPTPIAKMKHVAVRRFAGRN
jgi:hypothetical protein